MDKFVKQAQLSRDKAIDDAEPIRDNLALQESDSGRISAFQENIKVLDYLSFVLIIESSR
jgi:hypothetical protein